MSSDSTSPMSPIAVYPPIPASEYRSRAPEFYGFVAWSTTYLLFCLYVLWALLPDEWIIWLGVEWYPNRQWALLLPAYGMFLILLTYFVYFSLAISETPPISDMTTIIDSRSHFPSAGNYNLCISQDARPELYDIPIGTVNRVVYRNTN